MAKPLRRLNFWNSKKIFADTAFWIFSFTSAQPFPMGA